ncbi:MAG: hypothetical protein RLZZ500_2214 [Bacteroidota bacterium]|jgi:hypothetical protein
MRKLIGLWSMLAFGMHAVLVAQPQASLSKYNYTLAPVYVGDKATVTIPILNTGNQPLIISIARGTGTPALDWTKVPIQPKGHGVVIFNWPTTVPTKTTQSIFITTNAATAPIIVKVNLVVLAQEERNAKVSGVVVDSMKQPIPSVLVFNKKIKQAIQTDIDGSFTIKARSIDTLEIQSMGYLTKKVAANSIKDTLQLQEAKPLEESYGPQRIPNKIPISKPVTKQEVKAVKRREKK